MISAKELYEIARAKSEELIKEVLDGARDHVEMRRQERANRGLMNYVFYANKIFNHLSDQLYDRLLEELVVPFEEAGDCVSIYEDCYNEYTSFIIVYSWNNKEHKLSYSFGFENRMCVYTTEFGDMRNTMKDDDY